MTITFKEKEYPIREINGYIFATEELSDDLFSRGDILSGEAEAVDNQITYFMPVEDFKTLTDKEAWVQCYEEDLTLGEESDPEPYSIFLMIELAKVCGIMEKELEYDTQWAKGLMLYEGFENTTFNDEKYSEYDAIVNYLKSQLA